MTKRYCDTGRIDCPHLPECIWDCKYDTAVVERRKIKAYPIVPDDIKPVPEAWQTVGTVMLTAIMGVLAVICLALFFTGVWIWSLLI
jgi:hypothetical protein